MCREMDQIYEEGAKYGKAEGIEIGEMKKARDRTYVGGERYGCLGYR